MHSKTCSIAFVCVTLGHKQSLRIWRICVVLFNPSVIERYNLASVTDHISISLFSSGKFIQDPQMNLISTHAHINKPGGKNTNKTQSLFSAWILSKSRPMANFMHLSAAPSFSQCIMGSISHLMSWYTLLTGLGIRNLGLTLDNYLLHYFFFRRAGIYNQTLTSVTGPWRHLSVMIIRHILIICMMSFVLTMCQTLCVCVRVCRRWCREWTQHVAYMICSFQCWCGIDASDIWEMRVYCVSFV